jgi:predicted adenylyl cyclase CyaB
MAVEVELKAHIDDVERMKARLSAVGSYCRSYRKSDSYWLSPKAYISGVRVRREQGVEADGTAHESAVVTVKEKTVSGGIEVNDEREFTVSDAALFEELLGNLGMRRAITKEKNGWAWTIAAAALPQILAELSLVTGLGWFVELEIICPDNCGPEIEESRKRLLALLAELEIPTQRIESRPYTEMLATL